MKEKLKVFISSLSDIEIDEQLSDILKWAKLYQELLEKEKLKRIFKGNITSSDIFFHTDISKSEMFDETEFELFDDVQLIDEDVFDDDLDSLDDVQNSIDFRLAMQIQEDIAELSLEETKELVEKLKTVQKSNLDPQKVAEIHFELEACELHILELSEETQETCSNCGAEIAPNAVFCGNCGKRLNEKTLNKKNEII